VQCCVQCYCSQTISKAQKTSKREQQQECFHLLICVVTATCSSFFGEWEQVFFTLLPHSGERRKEGRRKEGRRKKEEGKKERRIKEKISPYVHLERIFIFYTNVTNKKSFSLLPYFSLFTFTVQFQLSKLCSQNLWRAVPQHMFLSFPSHGKRNE
jgi:hypothetical protein